MSKGDHLHNMGNLKIQMAGWLTNMRLFEVSACSSSAPAEAQKMYKNTTEGSK